MPRRARSAGLGVPALWGLIDGLDANVEILPSVVLGPVSAWCACIRDRDLTRSHSVTRACRGFNGRARGLSLVSLLSGLLLALLLRLHTPLLNRLDLLLLLLVVVVVVLENRPGLRLQQLHWAATGLHRAVTWLV
ncbi:hypothetical protein T492DRAFT_535395 [Pavlovales sp. CCMP2436]|nr:hypothetical protein T492DRAFT_535395 [Pavlovales sp. CCMP2436]